jgi:predicted dehydrogenase
MTSTLSAGIVGLGILGRQYIERLQTHAAVEIAALCDVRRDVAAAQAGPLGVAAYDDVAQMLAGQRLDLVVVATPDHLHLAPALAAVEAGTPAIILEKPLATTAAEAETLCAAVERRGTRLFVNFANRAMPLDLATYYIVQQGLIGAPVYAESRLDDNISVPNALWGARSAEFAAGSSPAHFLLSHVIDLMLWTFAPARVVEVFAISRQVVLGATPDLYDAYLLFDSGLRVRCKAEWIKVMDEIVEYYTSITGAQGSIVYNKRPGFGVEESWRANFGADVPFEEVLAHQQALNDQGILVRAGRHLRPPDEGYYASSVHTSLEHRGPDGATGMLLVGPILDALLEDTLQPSSWQGRGLLPTHVDGLRQVRVVHAIEESARRGQPVRVEL